MVDVEGYEGLYAITRDGRVWSYPKNVNANRNGIWRSLNLNHKGYLTVTLTKEGKHKTHFVHRLVAIAYIPNPNNLPQVNHVDGVKTNNRYKNLEWSTNRENTIHAYKNGLTRLKNTDEVVRRIHKLKQDGKNQYQIASLVGTDQGTVSRILSGKLRAI